MRFENHVLEHPHVEFEPHGCDVSRLAFAEQVTRSANFQVMGGESESAPQIVEFLQHPQALLCILRYDMFTWNEEVRVRPMMRAPHSTAELIELGKAERVGAVDDDRVGVGDVEARFDDRGAHKYVCFLCDEIAHDTLEVALPHLSVGDRDPRLGYDARHPACHRIDRLHPVVDEKHLPTAPELAEDCIAHYVLVEAGRIGPNREAVDWRCLDHAEIPNSSQRKLQRAGNRSRRQREHVDFCS